MGSPVDSDAKLDLARRPRARDLAESAPRVARRPNPETLCIDVQELGVVERVDQVRPDLETRRATEAQVLRHGDVPLVTAGQTEWRDRRLAILTCRRRYERRWAEPEETRLFSGLWVAGLIGPQRPRETPPIVITVSHLNSSSRT